MTPSPPLPQEDLEHVLTHTRALWAGAKGERFFITGGTGFFGVWLLESFAHANDTLRLGMSAVVLTRDPAAFARKAPHLAARADLVFHQGDLGSFAFPAGRFASLIHAAADTAIWTKGAPTDGLLDRMEAEVHHLLDFAAGAGVKNLLFVSSGAVYGPQPAELARVPEDYAGAPAGSAWGEAKRAAEQQCLSHSRQHGYAAKIARCFTFVGPQLALDLNYAIGNFIRDALRGEPIRLSGDGTPRRSYLYASDLAVWLWTILLRGAPGRTYNVGASEDLSIAELAGLVVRTVGANGPVEVARAPVPGAPVLRYVPDISRAERELGLRPRVPLAEAIARTATWSRAANRHL